MFGSSMSIDCRYDAQLRARAYFIQRGVDPVRHGGAGLRTFLHIAGGWRLIIEEQMALLGVHDPAIFEDWTTRVQAHEAIAIPVDVIVRIGCELSIYGSLRALLPAERAAEWLRGREADRIVGGGTALSIVNGR